MSSAEIVLADPGVLDPLAVPDAAAVVTQMLEQSKALLAKASDLEDVVEWKSRAAALETYTRQRDLGKEAGLSAQEIVRRCERRIGQLVREGQHAGWIASRGSNLHSDHPREDDQSRPADFLPEHALRHAAYPMTDGVSDDEFEAAIHAAHEEGNLSRANVVRKVRGEPTTTNVDRSEWQRGKRRIDPNRVVANTAMALDGLVSGLAVVDTSAVDQETVDMWADSMKQSIKSLNRFVKELTYG